MRVASGLLAVMACGILLQSAPARAYDNDLELYKLGNPTQLKSGDTTINADPFAQERFARFVGDFALALAPMPSGLASSLGSAGFSATFTSDLALIHPKERFSNGQTMDVWPTEKPTSSPLFIPTIHLRKGLPFGFEVGADVSYIIFSEMVATTAMLKWSLVEGFLYVPDLSAKVFATTVIGTKELNLVLGGWDVGLSERVPLWGSAELGLYGGYQRFGVSAQTNNIDFDPNHVDPNNPMSADTVFEPLTFGPILNPSTVFGRTYLGLEIRWELLVVGFDFTYGTGSNLAYTSSAPPATDVKVFASQTKLAFKLGVTF